MRTAVAGRALLALLALFSAIALLLNTSHDGASGKMGKVDIEVRFTTKS